MISSYLIAARLNKPHWLILHKIAAEINNCDSKGPYEITTHHMLAGRTFTEYHVSNKLAEHMGYKCASPSVSTFNKLLYRKSRNPRLTNWLATNWLATNWKQLSLC